MHRTSLLIPVLLASASGFASAQGPVFQSPGQSRYGTTGQADRFSREFNPALGFVVDTLTDYVDDDVDDGFDLQFRLLEFNASAFVDPDAWAYVALVSEEGEAPEVEEAVVEYIGFEGNSTLKAGLFFIDFGKQMQQHLEELRTLERPLVLREYLGEELGGAGVQYDYWVPLSDTTPLRFSAGAFASLVGEGHEDDGTVPEAVVPDRKDFDELSFAARVTAMTDAGESGLVQFGLSGRYVPEFAFEFASLEQAGLENLVYGADVTYGWTDETGLKNLAVGAEVLVADGDLSAAVDDPVTPTTITVVDDTVTGLFAFADYAWNQNDSAGVQYSFAELPENPDADALEFDLYYTRHFTEFRRLRLGVTLGDSDLTGEFFRVYLQFTAFFGVHSHGLNW